MKYLFELNHPKHYYQFKYVMQTLKSQGHEIVVLARDKDVLLNVLEEEGVPYIVFGKHRKAMWAKILGTFGLMVNYWNIARRERPDVIVSKASWYGTAMAKALHKKSVIFPDSEVVKVTKRDVVPLCTRVVTPQPFQLNYGEKHRRIAGIFEDCYLAPSVLHPDSTVVERYGLRKPYAIVRFVGWYANHDVGNGGFNYEQKKTLVETIARYMNVYISSEKPLPEELSAYKLPTPANAIHDVLYCADLYIGDSQTMAAEAALLGTPAIRSNTFVVPNDMSNFIMLEKEYGMLYNIADPAEAIEKAKQLAENPRKAEWLQKREQYYAHVGDTNAAIVDMLTEI